MYCSVVLVVASLVEKLVVAKVVVITVATGLELVNLTSLVVVSLIGSVVVGVKVFSSANSSKSLSKRPIIWLSFPSVLKLNKLILIQCAYKVHKVHYFS